MDTKLKLWVGGLILPLIEQTWDCLNPDDPSTLSITVSEYSLLALWRLTTDCKEISDTIIATPMFHEQVVATVMSDHAFNSNLVSMTVAIIRRLAGHSIAARGSVAELYLFTLATIVEMNA